MNEAILRHLGVALLGHWGAWKDEVPSYMLPTYTTYNRDKRMLSSLLTNKRLLQHITEHELSISNTIIGRATLVALALIVGQVTLQDSITHVEHESNDKLFNRIKTQLRIKRF